MKNFLVITIISLIILNLSSQSSCGNSNTYISHGLTNEQKKLILDKHNELRNKVASGQETRGQQPKATNMEKMVWNETVAQSAQTHGNGCEFKHSKSQDRSGWGENLAYSTYNNAVTDNMILGLVQLWYDEVSLFDKNGIAQYSFEAATGHYTQVVWANTNQLGCGITQYKDNADTLLLVCQYAPAGNFIGQPIYTEGTESCSACKAGQQCDSTYTALCADPNQSSGLQNNDPKKNSHGFNIVYGFIQLIILSLFIFDNL